MTLKRRGFLKFLGGLLAGGAAAKTLPAEAAVPLSGPPGIGGEVTLGSGQGHTYDPGTPAFSLNDPGPFTGLDPCSSCTRRDQLNPIDGQPGLFRCRRTGTVINFHSRHFSNHSDVLYVELDDGTVVGVRDLRERS